MRNSLRALTDWKRSSVHRNEQLVAQPALCSGRRCAPPLNRQVVGPLGMSFTESPQSMTEDLAGDATRPCSSGHC
jgi:hypothetical protein